MTNIVERPWGWYEVLCREELYQVKRLCIMPMQSISLQSHEFREEYWTCVRGEGVLTLGPSLDDLSERVLRVGEHADIARKMIHRVRCTSDVPLRIVEVQLGSRLVESDIVRYEDLYGRR